MTGRNSSALLILLILLGASILTLTGCTCTPGDPLGGKITVVGGTGKALEPGQSTYTPPAPPASPVPNPQEVERQITVTASNSVFSIGLPPGYTEERRVNAEQPLDFWFEYLNKDLSLTVNGKQVDIPERWSSKIGYTQGITSFSYVLKNGTGSYASYNLHLLPSQSGASVKAVTREKWIAP